MPDFLDRVQELQLEELDRRHADARLPDVPPPKERDCDDCSEPIDPRRLAALPTTDCCINCAETRARLQRLVRNPRA